MTGIELIKAPGSTAGELADIISKPCPPSGVAECDRISCRECWLAWLVTGEPPKEKGPSNEQTTPGEEGLHPNLAERIRQQEKIWRKTREMLDALTHPGLSISAPPPPCTQCAQP